MALVEDVLEISTIEALILQKVDSDFSLAELSHNVELVLMPVANRRARSSRYRLPRTCQRPSRAINANFAKS